MAYVINDNCITCGACAESCPVSAISAGEPKFTISEDECISCGSCVGSCPQDAILED